MLRNHDDTHFLSSSSCPPQDFHVGVSELLMRRSMSYSGMDRGGEELQGDDDMSDDGSQTMLGEKKRRLNLEQVKALEKSFELANKLEPERKMQLARGLGLQPRQIAIWFQNRRARWKTKQLEKDYDVLKRQFEAIKADNEALKESTQINLNKDNNEGSWSNGSENSCEVNLNNTTATDSTLLYHHHNNKNAVVFPPTLGPTSTLTQLLHTSSRPDDHHHIPASNEGFCNMFGGIIEENPDFWPWPEQQNFN
ncbi:hypothetical protein BUALT_Bualt04G0147300 [Buddleja alternifolia]|uniref:Homeobox-leucine zipper protein n=1 Tax=Buddleja alternifolia TaxID=168488 RepID=A0AAV6XVE4_9LAMI|nr:hypothetical protein BUALT_Bualt04G0147300 [Buddleja alternifolia]